MSRLNNPFAVMLILAVLTVGVGIYYLIWIPDVPISFGDWKQK
jgi:hypothetical protein